MIHMDTKNTSGDVKNTMLTGIQGAAVPEDDPNEVTEEDFAAKEKQDQMEAELLKMKFLGEDAVPKKEKKKKRKQASEPPTKQEELLDEVESVQEFYEILRMDRVRKIIRRIVVNITLVVCLFAVAGYLQYIYSSENGILANVNQHEHDYSVMGRRIDGDCQHLGYTVYICSHPYCRAETNVVDENFGNHKYRSKPEVVVEEETQNMYEVYECSICGEKNRVYIGRQE